MVSHTIAHAEEIHPTYGPCDALGPGGICSECAQLVAHLEYIDKQRTTLLAAYRKLREAREQLDSLWGGLAPSEAVAFAYRGVTADVDAAMTSTLALRMRYEQQ